METLWVSLVTLIAGGLVSGVATYLGTRHRFVLDYDADLRKRRIDAYSDLWGRLWPLAKYGKLHALSRAEVATLSEALRVWYFDVGGLFLSTSARTDYFALQELLTLVDGGWGWETETAKAQLSAAAREQMRTCGSRLRTSLTRDVGTRSQPKLRGDTEPVDRSLAGVYERESDGHQIELRFWPRILGGTRWPPRLFMVDPARGTSVDATNWNPDHLTLHAKLVDQDGLRRSRLLMFESGQIVEGPLPGEEKPDPAVLWHRHE